jgi:hypothetical protein
MPHTNSPDLPIEPNVAGTECAVNSRQKISPICRENHKGRYSAGGSVRSLVYWTESRPPHSGQTAHFSAGAFPIPRKVERRQGKGHGGAGAPPLLNRMVNGLAGEPFPFYALP